MEVGAGGLEEVRSSEDVISVEKVVEEVVEAITVDTMVVVVTEVAALGTSGIIMAIQVDVVGGIVLVASDTLL